MMRSHCRSRQLKASLLAASPREKSHTLHGRRGLPHPEPKALQVEFALLFPPFPDIHPHPLSSKR